MEDNTQNPKPLESLPSKKSSLTPFLFSVFFIIFMGIVAIGSYMLGAQKSNKSFPVEVEDVMSQTSLPQSTPTPGPWREYVMPEIGMSFKIPSRVSAGGYISEIREASSPDSTGSVFCARLAKTGFTPQPFSPSNDPLGCFPGENDMLILGGISPDFSEGREGTITDFQGFITDSGKYYARYIGEDNFSDVTVIAEPFKNTSGVEIIKLRGFRQEGQAPWPNEKQLAAIVNTKDETFRGISLLVNLEDIDEETFDKILSTFEFAQ